MEKAYIVAAVRTAVGKAYKGTLKDTRPDDLAAASIRGLLAKVPGLDPARIDDVILGCAMPEGEQGLNIARLSALRAGLPDSVPAVTVNRFCSSGLQAIAMAANAIMAGQAHAIVAGGVESMTLVPMSGNAPSFNPATAEGDPDVYLPMGLTAENVAREFGVTREAQDAFALESHRKAVAAIKEGRFKDEIVPVNTTVFVPGPGGRPVRKEVVFDVDEGPRADTTAEALAKLKPAFAANGTVTAATSSQMSDGSAATLVMSGKMVKELGLTPMARFVGFAVAGVEPERMGIGPAYAVPKLLKMMRVPAKRIDLYELNEAFAAQALPVMKLLKLDPAKVNVNGGAIALGHPLGCTGAKLTATILHELARRKQRYGVVTMCIGGGMGAAGLFERIDG